MKLKIVKMLNIKTDVISFAVINSALQETARFKTETQAEKFIKDISHGNI